MSDTKVRFAPSPTGFLHIGSARTALFNWLYARHTGGTFYLRIEDTDKERSKQEFLEEILDSLKWLGLNWDGELVFQSKRTDFYRGHAQRLIEKGLAYPDGQAILFRVPKTGKVGFEDLLHGKIEFDLDQHHSLAEDLVIFKSDGSPTYNFAVVCDDADMGITHVIRGDDHIMNTPKQTPLYEALGFKQPIFCHIPLILGSDRSRLSKRHGSTSIREYRQDGFMPEAMMNYLSLLGWSPGNNQEIISKEELVQKFDLSRVLKTGAMFGREKLEWVNAQYVRQMAISELTNRLLPYLKSYFGERWKNNIEQEWLEKVVTLYQERIFTLGKFPEDAAFFFLDTYTPNTDGFKVLHADENRLRKCFSRYAEVLESLSDQEFSNPKVIEEKSRLLMKELGMTGKEFIHPCRIALTGRTVSPGFFDTVSLLGKRKAVHQLRVMLELNWGSST